MNTAMFVYYQKIIKLWLLIYNEKFAQSETRINNWRSDYQRSDNEIWDKYEVIEWDYEVGNMK